MATTASTTGINTAGLSKIKSALNAYRNSVSRTCNVSATAAQVQAAVKGTSSERTLKQMAAAIDAKMRQYISQLNQYDRLLDTMKGAYTTNDSANTSFSEISKKLNQ